MKGREKWGYMHWLIFVLIGGGGWMGFVVLCHATIILVICIYHTISNTKHEIELSFVNRIVVQNTCCLFGWRWWCFFDLMGWPLSFHFYILFSCWKIINKKKTWSNAAILDRKERQVFCANRYGSKGESVVNIDSDVYEKTDLWAGILIPIYIRGWRWGFAMSRLIQLKLSICAWIF